MRVKFLGGARTVTGSATLLEKDSFKWLVDCGMFQGGKELEERNRSIQSYYPRDLSFILLTHAHIDHSGLIPKLVKEGFRGKVVCTKATFDLCEIMLRDSGHIQEMEAEWQNRKHQRSGKTRSEEHTSELQSRLHLVCRLLLEKKTTKRQSTDVYKSADVVYDKTM